jgi:hypothetical protein
MKNLLKPLSLALFVAAMLPTQNACNQTSPSSNPPTQNAHTQTPPPFDTIFATGPSFSFRKAIGGPASEEDSSLIQTSDGGYAIAGNTSSFGAGQADVYVVKLDSKGNLQWTKTIGGPKGDYGNSLIQTSDGGYAIAGATKSFGAEWSDVYVVKLDANGNLQWTKTIGGPKGDYGNSLIQTSDGGYAIAGATKSFGAGEWDVYVVKLDANGNLQWTKTIGGEKDDYGRSLIQTSDGGYAIAGKTESFGAGYTDVYVIKLDAHGNLQWTKTIGGEGLDDGSSIIQTSDGGYTIAGSASFGAEYYEDVCVFYDVYVVKLDANGNLQWTKTIGGPWNEEGSSLIQTSDGGYTIAGYTESFGAGEWDVYVVKLDAHGNLQWTKTIGGEKNDGGRSLIQTSDGGYAIAGATKSFGAGGEDVYVVKLDAKGNLQWTKTIGGPKDDWGRSLIQTSDGGYAIADYTNSFGAGMLDVYVVKLDASGNLQWTKTIGGPEIEEGRSLIQTSDGGYAIAGFTFSFGAGEDDVYVVKLDANGNLQWTKTIGGPKSEGGNSIIQTSDGGYAIAGYTSSFGAGWQDVYVVKLDKNGDACCAVSQTTSRVGSGGTLGSPTPSIGSGGTLTSPTSSTSSGGTLTNQCP